MSRQEVVHGDSLELLKKLRSNSFDGSVNDPPYELKFMNREWDKTGIAFSVEFWKEVLRVLKPGAHLAVHAAGRLYHRVACAIDDAGFEPREMVPWIFGTGQFLGRFLADGVGTRLKTGAEPIGLFRKPSEGDLSDSYAKWGVGGLQIERSRIPYQNAADLAETKKKNPGRDDLYEGLVYGAGRPQQIVDDRGRLPSNVLIDEDVAEELGDRARYFYCVKASRAERDAGLETFPEILGGKATLRKEGSAGLKNGRAGAGRTGGGKNGHPTVKPLDLTRWIVRLICPPGGMILDCFAGSGTTLCAAALEGVSCLGIEREAEYVPIIRARLAYWQQKALDECPADPMDGWAVHPRNPLYYYRPDKTKKKAYKKEQILAGQATE